MNIETAREYCLSKKAATEDTPFGEDFLVIRVWERCFYASISTLPTASP